MTLSKEASKMVQMIMKNKGFSLDHLREILKNIKPPKKENLKKMEVK